MAFKIGEEAAKQIASLVEHFAKRIINREVNRYRPPPGMQARYFGKTTSSITQGNSATIPIWSRGAADGENSDKGDESATGETISGCYARYGDIAANKWVAMEWIDGGWEVYCVECE